MARSPHRAPPRVPPPPLPPPARDGEERLLQALASPLATLICAAPLLLAGLGLVSALGAPLPAAGGLQAAEQTVLRHLAPGNPLASLPVLLAALLLLGQQALVQLLRPAGSPPAGLGWPGLLGLVLVFTGGLYGQRLAFVGPLELEVGETRESARVPIGGLAAERFLGQQVTLSRFSPTTGEGELQLRQAGGEPLSFAFAPGTPVVWRGLRLTPVGLRRPATPTELTLRYRPRTSDEWRRLTLRPGEEQGLGPDGTLVVERVEADLYGRGPAALIDHVGPDGSEDRRWVHWRDRVHEATVRSGPLVLELQDASFPPRLQLRVTRDPLGPVLLLGLGLLVVAAWRAARQHPRPVGGRP